MSATSPNPTQFATSQPGGTGDHTPHTKVAFGTGTGASGVVTNVTDTLGERLPVGGAILGTPSDTSAVASVLGRLLKLIEQNPASLTAGGNFRTEIMVDNSGVPTGQAISASSIPVVQPSDFGATPHSLIAGASVNATVVKASAGTLFGGYVHNRVTSERFVKFYDKTGSPAAADTPIHRLAIAGGVTLSIADLVGPTGLKFTNGLGYRTTTGLADADTGAVAANDLVINLSYK